MKKILSVGRQHVCYQQCVMKCLPMLVRKSVKSFNGISTDFREHKPRVTCLFCHIPYIFAHQNPKKDLD